MFPFPSSSWKHQEVTELQLSKIIQREQKLLVSAARTAS